MSESEIMPLPADVVAATTAWQAACAADALTHATEVATQAQFADAHAKRQVTLKALQNAQAALTKAIANHSK